MENRNKINEFVMKNRIGSFTTNNEDGQLVSRPIAITEIDDDGVLWFFTDIYSDKIDELINNRNVNFSFSNHDDNSYVSVSGTAQVVRDPHKIEELWNLMIKAWFPEGKESPRLALVRVKPSSVKYWDGTSSKIIQLYNTAKALINGEAYNKHAQAEKETEHYSH